MKKLFSAPKVLFSLLCTLSLIAMGTGVYLGIMLGMQIHDAITLVAVVGMLLWIAAWGTFMALCLRLRKGGSAFTVATGSALRIIGWCMIGLAIVALACALIAHRTGHTREVPAFQLIEQVLLPGFFLAVAAAAKILRVLLNQAIMIEKEQEGVV